MDGRTDGRTDEPADTCHYSRNLWQALKSHFMFQSCTPEQLEQILKAMRHKVVRAGQVVTLQGEASTQCVAAAAPRRPP